MKLYHSPIEGQTCVIEYSADSDTDFKVYEPQLKLNNSDMLKTIDRKLTHLNPIQTEQIKELLCRFPAVCGDIPTTTHLVKYHINLKTGTEPRKFAPYRTSPHKQKIIRQEIKFLLDNDFAEESNSPWASPCIIVPKPDGSSRLCVDYRHLNQVTISDCYPLPRIDDLIDEVGRAHYITKIDLLKGYHQIALTLESREITAFVTPDGLYHYKVLPFGLKNAPGIFQRLMNTIVKDLEYVKVYIDDLVVYTESWEDHVKALDKLFAALRSANLTINLSKTDFGCGKLQYLGYVIGSGLVAPVEAKIEAILKLSPPSTRRGVQKYLGMVGYYRRFCPNFSDVAAPLTELTSSKKKFNWTKECQMAFEKIKRMLMCAPVLQTPNFAEQFHLQVDASEIGAGAVLLQKGGSGLLLPIAFMSTKFKPHQKSYSTVEKEALSLLLALEKFAIYVSSPSHPVVVYTDHQPLQFVSKMRLKNARLTRWWLALQEYNLEVHHIKGADNVIADVLSRDVV